MESISEQDIESFLDEEELAELDSISQDQDSFEEEEEVLPLPPSYHELMDLGDSNQDKIAEICIPLSVSTEQGSHLSSKSP